MVTGNESDIHYSGTMELSENCDEIFRAAKLCHDLPEALTTNNFEQISETIVGSDQAAILFLTLLGLSIPGIRLNNDEYTPIYFQVMIRATRKQTYRCGVQMSLLQLSFLVVEVVGLKVALLSNCIFRQCMQRISVERIKG